MRWLRRAERTGSQEREAVIERAEHEGALPSAEESDYQDSSGQGERQHVSTAELRPFIVDSINDQNHISYGYFIIETISHTCVWDEFRTFFFCFSFAC